MSELNFVVFDQKWCAVGDPMANYKYDRYNNE